MPRGLTSPPLRLTCARYGCDKQFYSYPDRRGSTGQYQKFCCRACYHEQRRRELAKKFAAECERFVEHNRAREQAAAWYWLYGVPHCPVCVTGKTPCLSQDEAARAAREAVSVGTRCHCCGRVAR